MAAIIGVIATADVCVGTTYTWIGNSPRNWFDGGNLLDGSWSPDPSGAPLQTTDSLVFDGQGDFAPNQNGNAQITNLTFLSGFYTLGSDASSTLTVSGVLLQDTALLQTISNRVEFVTGAVVNTQSGELTLGNLAGAGNFTKSGVYDLRLSDAGAYTGAMTISAGSVFDDGNNFGGSINNNGGYFGGGAVAGSYVQSSGTGSFNSALSVNQTGGVIQFVSGTVTQASTLSGVNSITGATGQAMTFNSSLVLGSGNRTTFDLGAGGVADEYVVNGLLTYGGSMTLNFTTSGSQAIGTTWSVFDPNGGVSGTFAGIGGSGVGPYASLEWGLATSSTSIFDQRYGDGIWLSGWTSSGTSSQRLVFNQCTGDITVVPEPSTFVMAAAGIAGWGLMRYRRRLRAAAAARAAEAA